jgi:hypothetical protein
VLSVTPPHLRRPPPPLPFSHCRCNWEGRSAFSSSCQLSKTGLTNCGKCMWDQTCSNDPRRADTKPVIKIVNKELKKKRERAVLLAAEASFSAAAGGYATAMKTVTAVSGTVPAFVIIAVHAVALQGRQRPSTYIVRRIPLPKHPTTPPLLVPAPTHKAYRRARTSLEAPPPPHTPQPF